MELKEFIENFKELFEYEDVSNINEETFFKELEEWNSLSSLSLIAMVDEKYDVTLKGDDIRNADTIEDLFKTVQSRQ